MANIYYTYCSFDCAGKYYIGYTKKHIDTGYKGSYTASGFEPKCRINLYEGERAIAMWLESMYHEAWQVDINTDFANKVKAKPHTTLGFTSCRKGKSANAGVNNGMHGKSYSNEYNALVQNKARLSRIRNTFKNWALYDKEPCTQTKYNHSVFTKEQATERLKLVEEQILQADYALSNFAGNKYKYINKQGIPA